MMQSGMMPPGMMQTAMMQTGMIQPGMMQTGMIQPGMQPGMMQPEVNPYGQFPVLPTPEKDIEIPKKFREPTTDVMRPLIAPPSTTQSIRYNIPHHGRVYNPQIITSDPCMPWYTCSCLPDFDDYCRCCRPQIVQVMDADVPMVADTPTVNKVNTTYWGIESQRGLCYCWRPCDTSLVRTHYADVKILLKQHNFYGRCMCLKCRSSMGSMISPS